MYPGEDWHFGKAILPLNILLLIHRWGLLRGLLLTYIWAGVLGVWYFTMALMNHNAERCMDVDARNKARDWGEAQLVSSADWSVTETNPTRVPASTSTNQFTGKNN